MSKTLGLPPTPQKKKKKKQKKKMEKNVGGGCSGTASLRKWHL
jgi:hypothetical protein